MVNVQIAEAYPIYVNHPSVDCYQSQADASAVVVAVMLRPVFGRSERMRVLSEVAKEVADATPYGRAVPIYVVADVDVYQSILHGVAVEPHTLAARSGCYVLRPAENA